jgi:hypothetical protein
MTKNSKQEKGQKPPEQEKQEPSPPEKTKQEQAKQGPLVARHGVGGRHCQRQRDRAAFRGAVAVRGAGARQQQEEHEPDVEQRFPFPSDHGITSPFVQTGLGRPRRDFRCGDAKNFPSLRFRVCNAPLTRD